MSNCHWCRHPGTIGVDHKLWETRRVGFVEVCIDETVCDKREIANEKENERSLQPDS